MDRIIFLDIDGVLNHNSYYSTWKFDNGEKYRDEYGELFCPISSNILNKVIEQTQAKIVISSTWRHDGLQRMQDMWRDRKMSGEVIDITPHSERRFRGLEIEDWLDSRGFSHINWSQNEQRQRMEKSNIENYIIIDDDSDMTYNQRRHFIHVLPFPRNNSGFNHKYGLQALRTLKSDIITLNYQMDLLR